jgi:hypothetical protein
MLIQPTCRIFQEFHLPGPLEWKRQDSDGERYWGELRHGRRHGKGILLYMVGPCAGPKPLSCNCSCPPTQGTNTACWQKPRVHIPISYSFPLQAGQSEVRYEGQFVEGERSGLGVITTSRGDRYAGSHRDGLMWGPGANSARKIDNTH